MRTRGDIGSGILLRLPLLAFGMAALVAGLWAGLFRLGWDVPALRPNLPSHHGPLMVSGFLGTLISLERAVALGQRWAYAAPLLTGLGALALIVEAPSPFGQTLMTLGSLGLVVLFAALLRSQPTLFTATMGSGAAAWVVGNGLWLVGWPIPHIVPWWLGFLVFTIAGERLELSRLLHLSALSRAAFLTASGLLLVGLVGSAIRFEPGLRVTGIGLGAVAIWLLRYDVAWRTVRHEGLTRFIAVSLLLGYCWLLLGGVLVLVFGAVPPGPAYDALLHAIFLGFVFAMIFAHAPIIFPAILGIPVSFHLAFYAPLAMLHLSLLLRIGSDLGGWTAGRQWGGLLNVLAIVLFFGNMVRSLGIKKVVRTSRAPANAGVTEDVHPAPGH
ncbi:MAG: hypothetical protein AB1671_08935 [Thermodesulfobacteriota bacterium]|jgi:hypothetical protein